MLLTPVILFAILMILLYVPPVQNLIRRQATAIASEATGMDISVERIDLRFPLNLLVRGVLVVQPSSVVTDSLTQHPDTLLNLESLNVRIQAWPLFKGRVEIDEVTLNRIAVNSSTLIAGMQARGTLGYFHLESHGIDLNKQDAVLNSIELSDTRLQVIMADTTEVPEDTTKTALDWKVLLHTLKLKNIVVDLVMPLDSMHLATHIGQAELTAATADLKRQFYGWEKMHFSGTSVNYDTDIHNGTGRTVKLPAGFDASHIALRDIRLGLDSVLYNGRNINAEIREFAMTERSGLSITSLTGRLFADSAMIKIPSLRLLTPHSEINLSAQTYWELINIPTTGHFSARLDARIGKQDVLLFAGDLPDSFKDSYPFRPLVIHAGTEGNLKQMQISRFSADLPGAFALNGGGEFWNLTDSVKRSGKMDLKMQTENLNFLAGLAEATSDGSVVVPDSISLVAGFRIEGNQCTADLQMQEEEGILDLNASYNLSNEAYLARLDINALQVNHFLPNDSIYGLTVNLSAKGQGTDFTASRTVADLQASLKELQYKYWNISGVDLSAELKRAVATARLSSDNDLLKMKGNAEMNLRSKELNGKLDVDVAEVNLYKLGFLSRRLRHPFAFTLGAEARRDSVRLELNAGDLELKFRARSSLDGLMSRSDEFVALLMKQIEERHLDHAALRRVLPSAGMQLKAGKENPASDFLATKNISFDDFSLRFGFTPTRGINGRTLLNGLQVDSLKLDTLFFVVKQDTARMKLQGGVVNGPKNPQAVFRGTLTGEIRNDDAELTVDYVDGQGNTGVLFGLKARPLIEGRGKGNGLLLELTPDEPIVAFRKFHFVDKSKWIYIHKNMHVYANVDMDSDDGLCFRMQSNRQDTVSLQNINVELLRLRLDELSDVLPYMPRLTGLFSAEVSYVQTTSSLQVSGESNIRELTYNRQPVGDIGLGVTWLPGEKNKHYLNTYFTYNDEEVMTADGALLHQNNKDTLIVTTTFEHFPLRMANAFIPDQMAAFTGDIDGKVYVLGSVDRPRVHGDLSLDSVSVYARQAGARYWFDNRPVKIRNNQMIFNKFAIYTTSRNPFTIDGNIDFRNFDQPKANLKLNAENYTLLDAPRTRESLVYGKVFVDLNATVRGPLDALTMRGNMNLLGNTNVTYVLTDSPLTVEDRLDGLVTFTSFTDAAAAKKEETPTMSLGGMEMYMSVHIDDAVRLRADLTPDRSKFIELEGGGDLNMQYTPQGDMNLVGRYTLSGGVMKYSLPIIPLKEFQFNSGSYVDWRGKVMDPILNLKAIERVRAAVSNSDGESSRMVNFDVSIAIKNRLDAPELIFDLAAPDDAVIENELAAMNAEERSKQAITMLATGIYLNNRGKAGGLTMGTALNSVLQSQINSLTGNLKNASLSLGIEDRTASETGSKQTDYSFRYSQRFFNDRVQIVIGGKVSTGANATNDVESFIDNISLEYRLDVSGTRYVRVFYDKNYESVLDGEITETGVGLVLRRKMNHLGELFIFKRKKKGNKVTE